MTTEQDFHPDLLALLEKVWCGRKDIKSYDGIYLLYSSNQGGAKPSLNEDELEQFLESLPIDFTFRNSFGKEKLGQILVQDHGEWPNLKVARKRFDKKTLWDTFYHFNGEEEGAYKRIYIHVADTYVTNVLIIVRELLPLMPQIRGFLKISSP